MLLCLHSIPLIFSLSAVFQRLLSQAPSPSSKSLVVSTSGVGSSSGGVRDMDSRRMPAGFKGRGKGGRKEELVEQQLDEALGRSAQPRPGPRNQTLPAPFHEPDARESSDVSESPAFELPPFSSPADLVVTRPTSAAPLPPSPPAPTFPLNDPFAGKVSRHGRPCVF